MNLDSLIDRTDRQFQKTLFFRSVFVGVFGLVLVLVMVFRLYVLQVVDYEKYETQSRENHIVVRPMAPARGLIFDRNGVLLAGNRQVQSLALVKETISDLDAILQEVREFVEVTPEQEETFRENLTKVGKTGQAVTLRRNLNDEQIAAFAVNRYRIPDVLVTTETLREYPTKGLMSHVVGSVRQMNPEDVVRLDDNPNYRATKYVGRRGIEKYYESELHGEIGFRTAVVDVHGRVMSELNVDPPTRGQTLTLHLDARVQQAADDALGDRRGAVVAIEPSTGGILALVSKPTYDPNLFVMGLNDSAYNNLTNRTDKPLFNRATQGKYAPGSTFKLVVALAALSHGATDWEYELHDSNGEFRLPGSVRAYRDWNWTQRGTGGQGTMNLHRAIYRSSNIYFFELGTKLHVDQLAGFATQFGFGKQTALDVPDAHNGVLPNSEWKQKYTGERWYPGDSMNLFIGQGDLSVTPLQLATVTSLIANRGHWIRPRLLMSSERMMSPRKSDWDEYPRVEGPTEEDWDQLIDAMRAVVHRGNQGYRQNGIAWAHIGIDIPYTMAAKSGTAQVVEIPQGEEYDEELLEEHHRKHALFVAFAPIENPAIALAVVVENGGGGSSVAGPVARQVIDAYLPSQVAFTDG